MKAIPIAQYLSRQGKTVALAAPAAPPAVRRELVARPKPVVVAPTQEELIEAAYRKGRQAERESAQRELEAALLEQRKALDDEFSTKAAEARAAEAARLADAVAQGIASIETDIVDAIGAILRPLIDAALAERALEALKKHIVALFASDSQPMIRIRGPESLLREIQRRLPSVAAKLEYAELDGLDVVVTSDATCVATQLSAWKHHLDSLEIGAGNG